MTLQGTAGVTVAFVIFALPATLVMAARPEWARRTGAVFTVAFAAFPSSVIAIGDLPELGILSPARLVAVLAVMLGFLLLLTIQGQLMARLVVTMIGRPNPSS